MNKQGNTLQHYIDVVKYALNYIDLSIAKMFYDNNFYTSECLDYLK